MSSIIPKVVHLTPDFATEHPYNLQLIESLRALGAHIKMIRAKDFLPAAWQFNPDIVHVHWLHSFIETDADSESRLSCWKRLIHFIGQLTILRLKGIRIVWTVHELNIPETHHAKIDNLCVKLIARLSSAIIAHCQSARRQIIEATHKHNSAKVHVVPHGHFINVTQNVIDRKEARRLLDIPPAMFVVLFFGLMRPYKGVLDLLNAHSELNRQDVLLLLAGSSVMHHKECADYMETIKKSVAHRANVRLVQEFIPDNQIQVFMNASDIVAFPYRDIMTSGALIMAMGFGKACIASRLGCISETLDQEGAFLYDAGSKTGTAGAEQGLVQALEAALSNADKLPAMGKHNRRLAEEMDWQDIAQRTLLIYQKCLAKNK